MRTQTIATLLVAALAVGCGDPSAQEERAPEAAEPDVEQRPETSAVIFPDDSPPSESCDLGLPLSCGTTTWSVEYTTDLITRTRRTSTFGRSNNASISGGSSRGANLLCTATTDFVMTNVHAAGALVPRDGYQVRADRKGVDFFPRLSSRKTVPALGGPERPICTLWCSPDGNVGGCNALSDTEAWKARVIGPGVNKTVTLTGTVDRVVYDDTLQLLQVYCRLTLPRNQMVTSRRRPDDVISTSGSRFVRGYELTGTSLRNACSALASLECLPTDPRHPDGIVELCINPRTETCVSDFSRPDPCHPVCQTPCTSAAQCGSHFICNAGCCRANPH